MKDVESAYQFIQSYTKEINQKAFLLLDEVQELACLLHLVPREDVIGKQLLKFQEKIYLTDHGIREAIYGNNMRDVNQILEKLACQ